MPESATPGGAPPPRPFGALLLARLAGEAGLGWLGQEPAALHALAAYFGDGPSELRAIAEEAERRIGLPLDRGPTVPAPIPPSAVEAAADPPDAPQPQAATAEPERTPPPAIGGEGAGWEWINWVRTGLRDGSVAVNAAGAWLHNIAGEAYVVSPATDRKNNPSIDMVAGVSVRSLSGRCRCGNRQFAVEMLRFGAGNHESMSRRRGGPRGAGSEAQRGCGAPAGAVRTASGMGRPGVRRRAHAAAMRGGE